MGNSSLSSLFSSRIWLIGGTSESAVLAEAIAQSNLPSTITVTTETAKKLYGRSPVLRVKVGRLNPEQMADFVRAENIIAILDASHPHAADISRLAIATATKYQIPYLRYERLEVRGHRSEVRDGDEVRGQRSEVRDGDEVGGHRSQVRGGEKVRYEQLPITHYPLPITHYPLPITLDSFETLVGGDYLTGNRVLLTSGYKSLHLFKPWQHRCTLFVRVLPSVESLQGAIDAGFAADRIIAIRPPVSRELEKALWQQWQISLVVTKASGVAGGEDIKRSLSTELGVGLIIIERPKVNYPQQTSDVATAVEFCHRQFGS